MLQRLSYQTSRIIGIDLVRRQCYPKLMARGGIHYDPHNNDCHPVRYTFGATVVGEFLSHASRHVRSVSTASATPTHPRSASLNNLATNVTPQEGYEIKVIAKSFWSDLELAAAWQLDRTLWKPEQCREVVGKYDAYLKQLVHEKQHASNFTLSEASIDRLLSSETVTTAFKALIKCHFDSPVDLAVAVRQWERHIGHLGRTQLTDHLSLRLLTANAKAGNLGRCLSLLELRAQKQYRPRKREFLYTITAIQVAAVAACNGTKNIFVPDRDQPVLDNPTRWLDAVLIHMKQRNYPLTTELANIMLQCYAGTGYTGKASHHFYRVARHAVESSTSTSSSTDNHSNATPENQRPRDWFYVPQLRRHVHQETQVKLIYNRQPPPFFKIPAQARGKLLFRAKESSSSASGTVGQFRMEHETEPDYSVPLAAAFAFADSLQHGACGHEPVAFNVGSYNALIKTCVYRGALWRAMHVLETVIPNASHVKKDGHQTSLQPNHTSYNLILAGLARVGDVVTAQDYYRKMVNETGLEPDAYTVRAIVDGLLNLADAPAAVTVVQDFFNQHSVLPPYTTHCKILEFCLARGMIYEAKRHVYFIQQLWHWKPVEKYHTPQFIQLMRATQRNTQLQKPALEKLFAYFGESLDESDFL